MATPQELREETAALVAAAAAELAPALAAVQAARLTVPDLREFLAALFEEFLTAAQSLAADWYEDSRLDVAPGGDFAPPLPEPRNPGVDALTDWALGPDWEEAARRFEAGIQLRIANAVREALMEASVADPAARGWQRVGDGDSCPFCLLLISRGAVYTSATARFGAHDDCGCMAVPAWGGQPLPVEPYEPTSRRISDADRERVRAWIAANT